MSSLSDVVNELDRRDRLDQQAKQSEVEALEVLKQIETNTSYLRDIADLVSASNEHQKELTELVNSILDIAKAPDKREANTRYRSVMKRIGDFATVTTSGINIAKLVQLATAMFQMMM